MVLVGSMVVVSVFFTMSTINMVQTSIPMFLPRLEERKLTDLQQNLSHEDLKKLSKTELVRLWHSLPAPKLSTVSGFYDGRIACVGPLHPVSRFLTHNLFGPGSWAGKQLYPRKQMGENIFITRRVPTGRRVKSQAFKMQIERSVLDKKPALVFDYHESGVRNSFPWSTMRDEVREIRPGILLGIGGMGATLGNLNSAIFTLERNRR